jgi:hypothetical protein
MGRAEEPPRPASAEIQPEGHRPPAIRDVVLDAVEAQLTDDDFGDRHTQALAERAQRLLADQALVEELAAADFAGPVANLVKAELAAYGIPVIRAWIRTGEIVPHCRSIGRPVSLAVGGQLHWTADDRLELAIETVAKALDYFFRRVLSEDRWDYRKGASLKTFFIGACLLQFPNIYESWARAEHRWRRTNDQSMTPEAAELAAPAADSWADPTAAAALRRSLRRHALELIEDPVTRRAVELILQGHTVRAAAEAVGLTEKALAGRIYRLQRKGQEGRPS